MSSRTKTRAEGARPAERGTIGLGDLMRALDSLDTRDPATVERIARSLGFGDIDANPVEAVRGVSDAAHRPRLAEQRPAKDDLPHYDRPPPAASPLDLPEEILETDMAPVELPAPADLPEWLDGEAFIEEIRLDSMARAKLFPDRSAKGVLTAAVATRRAGTIPDFSRLLTAVTRGSVLTEFPYRPSPSLHRGVQLLMDTAEAMTPFLEDLADLARIMRSVVGRHACDLYEFRGNPNMATHWTADDREIPWQPVPGRPVILASDLGIGAQAAAHDRGTLRDWLGLIQRSAAAGVPIMALVPHGRDRWPRSLTRRIRFIHWDPRTRASHIKKMFGPGHEVGR